MSWSLFWQIFVLVPWLSLWTTLAIKVSVEAGYEK